MLPMTRPQPRGLLRGVGARQSTMPDIPDFYGNLAGQDRRSSSALDDAELPPVAYEDEPSPQVWDEKLPGQTTGLPKPPPGLVKRDTNPWSRENRSRTLRDIGTAFLSNENSFLGGLGAAAQAVSAREDYLKAPPKSTFGGPDDQFEITVDPRTGERTIREVPEFSQAVREKRAAAKAPTAPPIKDAVELRARAIRAIGQLPMEQRSAAYADLMANPQAYGGIDTTGMPVMWDDRYNQVMGGMGQTVNQAESSDYRDRAFGHRVEVDNRRLTQGDTRIQAAAAKASASKLGKAGPKRTPNNYGSDLDY